jgi:basic membrane protein A
MKKLLLIATALVTVFTLTACGGSEEEAKGIAIVTSAAGANDNGYNESAVDGAKRIKDEFGVNYHVVETTDVPAALAALAEDGYELIFSLEYNFDALINGIGGEQAIAEQYPDTTFVIFNANPNVDAEGNVIQENVISVIFDVHESSYLAGALAVQVIENADVLFGTEDYSFASTDTTGRAIGFIGGVQSSGITVFSFGFVEGINRAATDLDVHYDYYTDYSAGFGDPANGSTIANTMFNSGANLVYSVAGVVGDGVASKANEVGRLAIQVDANKDTDQPGHILTSVLKNTTVPVYELTKLFIDGELGDVDNALTYDLNSGATGITDLATIEAAVIASGEEKWAEIVAYVQALSDEITAGTTTVTDAVAGEELVPANLTNVTLK